MAGLAEVLTPRENAIAIVASTLGFPWPFPGRVAPISQLGGRLLSAIPAPGDFPPYFRSTRDGYAVKSDNCFGASSGSPAFLALSGEVPMGEPPSVFVKSGQCVLIYTGGILPDGADSVVMLEDTDRAGHWIEVRKAVQKGENLIFPGEEFRQGDSLLIAGTAMDFRSVGVFAMAGIMKVSVAEVKVGIISTGDEIVPPETQLLPPGCFRDANASIISALLRQEGYSVQYYGIAADTEKTLADVVTRALSENDVVIISGGSSVSVRDHSSAILENLPPPGLFIRGILMSPGKPTLIAGMEKEKKLVVGLPGHPFSCFVSAYTVLLPLLRSMVWETPRTPWKKLIFPSGEAVYGHSGIEEFVPCVLRGGRPIPFPVKSSFTRALAVSEGLFRLSVSQETIRPGEEAEIWLW